MYWISQSWSHERLGAINMVVEGEVGSSEGAHSHRVISPVGLQGDHYIILVSVPSLERVNVCSCPLRKSYVTKDGIRKEGKKI